MYIQVEFRRAISLTAGPRMETWQRLARWGENVVDDYGSLDELIREVRHVFENHQSRSKDYQCRAALYDDNDNEVKILGFTPAYRGATADHESNTEEIPFNWDGSFEVTKPTGEFRHMIKVGVRRIGGKLMLLVNAKEFHDQLDEIGCTHTSGRYNDQPPSATSVATSTHMLSTSVLLTRDYKDVEIIEAKKKDDGTVEKVTTKMPVTAAFDLSSVWATPPSFEQLKKLCNSANDAARKILEHYQPVDICVEIHKKIVK